MEESLVPHEHEERISTQLDRDREVSPPVPRRCATLFDNSESVLKGKLLLIDMNNDEVSHSMCTKTKQTRSGKSRRLQASKSSHIKFKH